MFESAGKRGDGTERSGLLESVAKWMQLSLLWGIVLISALYFTLGVSLTPSTVAGPSAQFTGATERVSVTVSGQRARQALRMEADRQKLNALRTKVGSYVQGWVKSFERRTAKLHRYPPLTDRDQALTDLDTGLRQEREPGGEGTARGRRI